MDAFWTNRFFSNPLYFIYLLVGLTIIFHLVLVWPRNVSRRSWKRVDYIWLTMAAIGVLGVASTVRISVAEKWVESERKRAAAPIERVVRYFQGPAESNHMCFKFRRTEFSPSDLDQVQLQYDMGCEWFKQVSGVLKGIDTESLPELRYQDFPEPKFDSPVLNESVEWFQSEMAEYSDQRMLYLDTLEKTTKADWEFSLAYFAPFLMCGAIALRIAKVSGELRHD